MLGFIATRIGYLVPVLIAVTLLTFLIASLLPGDLAHAMLGDQATPEAVEALRRDMGLDRPLAAQYLIWLKDVTAGNFGTSIHFRREIGGLIGETLPATVDLMGFSIFIASSTQRTSPISTVSPGATSTCTIVPCIGTVTVPSSLTASVAAARRFAGPALEIASPPPAGSHSRTW